MANLLRPALRPNAKRGFTLIELAIVLGVASILFTGLWRLMSSGNTQLRDQATAKQHLDISDAIGSFLSSTEGQSWLADIGANATAEILLPATNTSLADCKTNYADTRLQALCSYVPLGVTGYTAAEDVRTTNAYGQSFAVRVLKDDQIAGTVPKSYSYMVLTLDGDTIPDTSGGRIATFIGSEGGFVYETTVCTANYACGSYGSWSATPASYGFMSWDVGHVASRVYKGLSASQGSPWLARSIISQSPLVAIDGGSVPDFNTLQVDTYLGTVPSTSLTAMLYGSASSSGFSGGIDRVRTLTSGRTDDTIGQDPSLLLSNFGCERASTSDTSCDYVAQINGDVAISGFLTANKLFAGQFVYETESDIRLKKDIKPIEDVLSKFAQMNGYSFKMKKSGEQKLGVIAQEVQKVFPEVVAGIDSKYLGVDYPGLVGPLVAAVNALNKENIDLKDRLEAQDQRLKALEEALKSPK